MSAPDPYRCPRCGDVRTNADGAVCAECTTPAAFKHAAEACERRAFATSNEGKKNDWYALGRGFDALADLHGATTVPTQAARTKAPTQFHSSCCFNCGTRCAPADYCSSACEDEYVLRGNEPREATPAEIAATYPRGLPTNPVQPAVVATVADVSGNPDVKAEIDHLWSEIRKRDATIADLITLSRSHATKAGSDDADHATTAVASVDVALGSAWVIVDKNGEVDAARSVEWAADAERAQWDAGNRDSDRSHECNPHRVVEYVPRAALEAAVRAATHERDGAVARTRETVKLECAADISAAEARAVVAQENASLRSAQLLMVGSEAAGDTKLNPENTRDSRWTPTLREVAKLRHGLAAAIRERDEALVRAERARHEAENAIQVEGLSERRIEDMRRSRDVVSTERDAARNQVEAHRKRADEAEQACERALRRWTDMQRDLQDAAMTPLARSTLNAHAKAAIAALDPTSRGDE